MEAWHGKPIESLLEDSKADPVRGLSSVEAKRRPIAAFDCDGASDPANCFDPGRLAHRLLLEPKYLCKGATLRAGSQRGAER